MDNRPLTFDELVVGQEFPETLHHVGEERVRSYIELIGDRNPLYIDETYARERGLERCPAPPTVAGSFIPIWASMWWGVSPEGTVPIRWGYRFHRPIYAGDTFRTRARVVDKSVRKGRKVATFEITAWNQEGHQAVTGTLVAIWAA